MALAVRVRENRGILRCLLCDRPGRGRQSLVTHVSTTSGSRLQSQVNSVCQSMMLKVWSVESDWSVKP